MVLPRPQAARSSIVSGADRRPRAQAGRREYETVPEFDRHAAVVSHPPRGLSKRAQSIYLKGVPFEVKFAFKYLRGKRKSLARFTSAVAVVGIAAGVACLIVADALARGFADEMREKILASTTHIAVFRLDGSALGNWREIEQTLGKVPNVERISPTTYQNALVVSETDSSHAVLKVRGPNSEAVLPAPGSLVLEPGTIAVGAKLAEKLDLLPGDPAEIITLENQTPQRFRVTATFETGLYEYDSTWVYLLPVDFARLHEQRQFTPTVLNISVGDIYRTNETARAIRDGLGAEFRVVDWQEANRPLFAALSLERRVALAIISLIILIAALNITTTLALLVSERRLDIAILRSCGARTRSLVLIFLLEGLFIGLTGIFAGIVLGLAACFLGNHFRVISLPAEVYSVSHIPFHTSAAHVLLIAAVAFFLCLVSTLYPALRASRIKPLENLRTQ